MLNFIVQLSHPYMTTGKTIALTRQTFVGKVMSLLFNMLSRLVITFLPRNKCLLISWLQSPSAVILEPPRNRVCLFPLSPYLQVVYKVLKGIFYLNLIPNYCYYKLSLALWILRLALQANLSADHDISIQQEWVSWFNSNGAPPERNAVLPTPRLLKISGKIQMT